MKLVCCVVMYDIKVNKCAIIMMHLPYNCIKLKSLKGHSLGSETTIIGLD